MSDSGISIQLEKTRFTARKHADMRCVLNTAEQPLYMYGELFGIKVG